MDSPNPDAPGYAWTGVRLDRCTPEQATATTACSAGAGPVLWPHGQFSRYRGGVTTQDAPSDDALMSRLRVIEDQPLATRADAYAHLHDELREVLEGGDIQRTHD